MKDRFRLVLIPVVAAIAILIGFQNCSSDFDKGAYNGSSNSPTDAAGAADTGGDGSGTGTGTDIAPVFATESPNLVLKTDSPNEQKLSVVVEGDLTNVTYQWWHKANAVSGQPAPVSVAMPGATSATLDLSSKGENVFANHLYFASIAGSYFVVATRGSLVTQSKTFLVSYEQNIEKVDYTASCSGAKIIGGDNISYSGSMVKSIYVATWAVTYSAPVMKTSLGSHTCTQVAGKAKVIDVNGNPVVQCYSDGDGAGVRGRMERADATGIRISATKGNSRYMTAAESAAATTSCVALFK